MKIATFNVNGVATRLPNLLQWVEAERAMTQPSLFDRTTTGTPRSDGRKSRSHEAWKPLPSTSAIGRAIVVRTARRGG